MKCPKCDGRGYVYNALGSFYEDCGHCQGTGMVRVEGEPMTEQEYLQTCTTEQLADALLAWWFDGANTYSQFGLYKWEIDEAKDKIVEWLKQPHTEKE